MPFKIIRNDITKMKCDAIVNTANAHPTVGSGCDLAIYKAAGFEQLLEYRKENIGFVPEGDVFITPAFHLDAKYIIHAVSPHYVNGEQGEEDRLRSCYQKSLQIAYEHHVETIAFPLISTGGFGYPKEEGMRIAVDEINAFLMNHPMQIYLVVFDSTATRLGERIYPGLDSYIDQNYVSERSEEEYEEVFFDAVRGVEADRTMPLYSPFPCTANANPRHEEKTVFEEGTSFDFYEEHESKLQERMKHMSDTFSEYLLYLIEDKGLTNVEVYKKAIVDKKVFSKIKNNPDYHPKKMTAMCLCVGARLNLDETKDLLARAGYALSPCDKTDVIFSYFIENKIYDMIELDIQLEEHGLKCLIS